MTLRARLALWYGALLALVLAAALTVTFLAHTRTHETDADNSLRASWTHAAAELLGPTAMPMPMRALGLTAPAQAASAPTAIWLVEPGGVEVAKVGATGDPVLYVLPPRRSRRLAMA